MIKADIIIIGAGISGLVAGNLLNNFFQKNSIQQKIIILEARERFSFILN